MPAMKAETERAVYIRLALRDAGPDTGYTAPHWQRGVRTYLVLIHSTPGHGRQEGRVRREGMRPMQGGTHKNKYADHS